MSQEKIDDVLARAEGIAWIVRIIEQVEDALTPGQSIFNNLTKAKQILVNYEFSDLQIAKICMLIEINRREAIAQVTNTGSKKAMTIFSTMIITFCQTLVVLFSEEN